VTPIGTGVIYGQNLPLETDSWRPLVAGAFAGGPGSSVDDTHPRSGMWLKGYGLFAHEDDGGIAPGFTANTGGIIVGAQTALNDAVTVGAAANYAQVSVSFDDAEGAEHVDQFKAAAYVRYEDGALYIRGLVGVSTSQFHVARMADPTTVAEGRFSGTGGAFFAEIGRAIDLDYITVTPSLRLGYVGARVGGFDETGAQSLDLTVSSAGLDSFTSLAGIKIEKTFRLGEGSAFNTAVNFGWEHQLLDTAETLDAAYAGGPTNFIAGDELPRDGLVVGVKLGGQALGRVHWFAGYDIKLAGPFTDQTAAAGLKVRF